MTRWFQFCFQQRKKNNLTLEVTQLATSLQSLESAMASQHSASREIFNFLKVNLPKNLLLDSDADWARWPGSIAPK